MEKTGDLDAKYQKLAAEYSKVRSQATVLKKALLDEQARNNELKDVIKKHEQNIRKHDQEMESLTFRNEQLTKRISVLQQELQVNHTKKGKNKTSENLIPSNTSVINEELQKKILENAQLVSSMVDKDYELSDLKERIVWLDNNEKGLQERESKYVEEIAKLKQANCDIEKKLETASLNSDSISLPKTSSEEKEIAYWKTETERWRSKYEILSSKPQSNEKLTEYYESQLKELLEIKQTSVAEAKSLWAETTALHSRLDNLTITNKDLESMLEKSNEELFTTIENYKGQLDAMTEHLAAQNDKITKQCDEIQVLRHKVTNKK